MLSADLLSDLATAFKTHEATDPSHQNRRAIRVPHAGKSMIYLVGGGKSGVAVPIQLRDISTRGCSFTTKSALPPDTTFILQFARGDSKTVGVLCTVRHCRVASGQHRIGAEFTCILTDQVKPSPATDASETKRIQESIFS